MHQCNAETPRPNRDNDWYAHTWCHPAQRALTSEYSLDTTLKLTFVIHYYYSCCYTLFPPRGKVNPADSLQLKAATNNSVILHLDGLARCKQDSINHGHGAQYLYRPPPAGASTNPLYIIQFGTGIMDAVARHSRFTGGIACIYEGHSSTLHRQHS